MKICLLNFFPCRKNRKSKNHRIRCKNLTSLNRLLAIAYIMLTGVIFFGLTRLGGTYSTDKRSAGKN